MGHTNEQRKAKVFYKSIGQPWSPGANDYVAFTRAGFNHIFWKNGERRPGKERMWRLGLLAAAEEIVKSKNVKVSRRTDVAHDGISKIRYWALTKEINGRMTKVVIRQLETARSIFIVSIDTIPILRIKKPS